MYGNRPSTAPKAGRVTDLRLPCGCPPGAPVESLAEYRRVSFHTHVSRLRLL